jgi:Arc/MetJ family transcription regulator
MVCHMKTTVHISDAVFAEAQELAAQEGTTLKALVDEGLRKVITERRARRPFTLRRMSVSGQGLHPDLEHASWETIRALAYGEPK